MKLKNLIASIAILSLVSCSQPDGVSFGNLTDGQEVQSPVQIEMVVSGMEIKPAGEMVKGTGHHHIIVDGAWIKAGDVVPANATHIHFGKGQTEASLDLTPGEHTLTLQFANGAHQSYGESWSKTITVSVK